MIKNNKINLILHFFVVLFASYIIYMRFIRFLLADNESIAIAMLNPELLPTEQPVLFSGVMLVLIIILLGLLQLKPSKAFIYRIMKALFGYSMVFLFTQFLIVTTAKHFPPKLKTNIYQSKNLFVEIQASSTRLREQPSLNAKVITTVEQGTLLLLNDVRKAEKLQWNRVLYAPKKFGWIARIAPEQKGNAKRLSKTNKFYFTSADQYSFLLAFVGFIWGFLSYRKI